MRAVENELSATIPKAGAACAFVFSEPGGVDQRVAGTSHRSRYVDNNNNHAVLGRGVAAAADA